MLIFRHYTIFCWVKNTELRSKMGQARMTCLILLYTRNTIFMSVGDKTVDSIKKQQSHLFFRPRKPHSHGYVPVMEKTWTSDPPI